MSWDTTEFPWMHPDGWLFVCPTIFQKVSDGTWWWTDETEQEWGPYATEQEAAAVQKKYAEEVLG